MYIAKWKKQDWNVTYHMIPVIWHLGKGKTIQTLESTALGLRGESEDVDAVHRWLLASVSILYDTIMVLVWHTFVKTHRNNCTAQKVNSCEYELHPIKIPHEKNYV